MKISVSFIDKETNEIIFSYDVDEKGISLDNFEEIFTPPEAVESEESI